LDSCLGTSSVFVLIGAYDELLLLSVSLEDDSTSDGLKLLLGASTVLLLFTVRLLWTDVLAARAWGAFNTWIDGFPPDVETATIAFAVLLRPCALACGFK